MSQAKHTPGPWQATVGGWAVFGPDYRVANVVAATTDAELRHAANAVLIAAAPELLAACQQAERMLRVALDEGLDFPPREKAELIEKNAGLKQIRDAIRKATHGA